MTTAIVHRNVPPSVAETLERQSNRLANMAKAAKEQTAKVVRTAECAATGAVLGFVDGRYDKREVSGAPIAAIAAVGAHVGGFILGGKDAEHLHAVGDAAIAVHAANVAREIGAERRRSQNQTTTTQPGVGGY